MGNQISGYDQRQLDRMLDAMQDYQCGKGVISSLINRLGALIDALEGIRDERRDALRRCWAILEDTYAISLAKGRSRLSENETRLVSLALNQLKDEIANMTGGTA